MAQSLSHLLVHIVYSTKGRYPWLKDKEIRKRLYAYQATVMKTEAESVPILINGIEDHVHILCLLSRKIAMMDLVKVSKTETSKWLKKQGSSLQDFQWQAGYGAFSVSQSNAIQVQKYIANQEEHHQQVSFQDEFRSLCSKHGIKIDEQYVWD